MSLTVEAPNFEKIEKEAGQFTSDAINLLWLAINDTRTVERRDFRMVKETLAPKVLALDPSASVDNLNLEGASILNFTGSSAQNVTGFRAPSTNESHVLFIETTGSGTITIKHNVTSEDQNKIITSTGVDVARATNQGIILVYLSQRWREVARSG